MVKKFQIDWLDILIYVKGLISKGINMQAFISLIKNEYSPNEYQVCEDIRFSLKYFFLSHNATFTSEIKTGTSTKGPITAANDSPELIPNTATETAMANSKLLLAAVNDRVAVFE